MLPRHNTLWLVQPESNIEHIYLQTPGLNIYKFLIYVCWIVLYIILNVLEILLVLFCYTFPDYYEWLVFL